VPRFVQPRDRQNFVLGDRGLEYERRLSDRAHGVFASLLQLLPSNYTSTVEGPNYTAELKAIAVEVAHLELSLEDVDRDRDYEKTRSEFLQSMVGYLVCLSRKPELDFDDAEFRHFILSILGFFFEGAVPKGMVSATELFTDGAVKLTEYFKLAGTPGIDISDQHTFTLEVDASSGFPIDVFRADSSVRALLDILRPAHTIYRFRYVFTDVYDEDDIRASDEVRYRLSIYHYDDVRAFFQGVAGKSRLGKKSNQQIFAEDHTGRL
jgi:hypothetical protein